MKFISLKQTELLALGFLLMLENASGEGNGTDAMPVCLLSLLLQGLGNEVLNLGWYLRNDSFTPSVGYPNCILSQGHIQAVANCNAGFFSTPNSTHLSLATDRKSFFDLCPNSGASDAQFLYTPKITLALMAQMQTLGECLLKQSYIPLFCDEEFSDRGGILTVEIVGGICAISLLVIAIYISYSWCKNHRRESSLINNSSSTNSNYGATNSNAADDNTPPQAGMLTRFFHQVLGSVTALRNPDVPSANIDNDQSSDARNNGKSSVYTPLL